MATQGSRHDRKRYFQPRQSPPICLPTPEPPTPSFLAVLQVRQGAQKMPRQQVLGLVYHSQRPCTNFLPPSPRAILNLVLGYVGGSAAARVVGDDGDDHATRAPDGDWDLGVVRVRDPGYS